MPIELEYKDKKIRVEEGLEDTGVSFITETTLPELPEAGIGTLSFESELGATLLNIWIRDPSSFFYKYYQYGVVEGGQFGSLKRLKLYISHTEQDLPNLVTIGKPGKEQIIIRYQE